MSDQQVQHQGQQDSTSNGLKRRGILTAAGIAMAGILAKQVSEPVSATVGMVLSNPETTTTNNPVTGPSQIGSTSSFTSLGSVLIGNAGAGVANAGIQGSTLLAIPNAPELCGIFGNSGTASAVLGSATISGNGVKGISSSGNGVYGTSTTGYGVLGFTTGGSASLSGISTNVNIPAFAGGNSVAGGLAATFNGTVYVNGMFVVADMTQKHGLLKHPDGSHRLMYTVEAPESWAEDFGTGTLAGGRAEVKLDPDFAALIHTEEYHVFLTDHAKQHLSVTRRGADGFTVEADEGIAALKGKKTSELVGTFSWRLVAKPKSTHKTERLGTFTIPQVKLPDPATLLKPQNGAISDKVPQSGGPSNKTG